MNISLPQPMAALIEQAVASGSYSTKSEFFRSLVRDWSEKRLAIELKESREEMKSGKGKLLKSLRDLR
jgi:Arc/MetJ-type ribon-helix-helix transcriptional regulator